MVHGCSPLHVLGQPDCPYTDPARSPPEDSLSICARAIQDGQLTECEVDDDVMLAKALLDVAVVVREQGGSGALQIGEL